MKCWPILSAALSLLFALSAHATSSHPDGRAIFQEKCAMCHRTSHETRAPSQAILSQLSRRYILRSLESGDMKPVGLQLTKAERIAVARFLSSSDASEHMTQAGLCTTRSNPLLDDPGWTAWGEDLENSRFAPEDVSHLDRSQVPRLKLKWAFAFPGAYATYGQPAVFGGRVYVGSEDGTVYSLDAKTGCVYWTFKAPSTVKTAVVSGFGGRIVYFGDVEGNVYAANASTGKLIWKAHVDPHPAARITGSPAYFEGRLYVPVSSGEEGAAIDPKYACCTFRGSLVALNARTGKQLWKTYTIPDPAHLTGQKNSAGTPMWGPSGAAIWSPPTIDTRKQEIYVATGNSYSDPPSPYTDSVIAFRMSDGKMLWHQQLTPNDRWNIACVAPGKVNCPDAPGNDFDFGSPPMLRKLSGGRRALIAGQKSGMVYALDPDRHGRILWETRVGKGGPLGGIEWGGAASGNTVYFPVSDWDPNNPAAGGGLFALRADTGARVWFAPPSPPACLKQVGCSAAQSSPPTVVAGVVFSGSEDGHLRAYDARDGKVLWDFDALKTFQAVNGIVAQGGSMNATGPAVVNGMLYVEAGYTNNVAGNVLLGFSVEKE
ncbi:MAG TPA: PQQ-binding-like beta-propeller repeat protein [Terriglobia bacterium]|nr:PQQ-binding-like beta-propeller repeat protein [Terriglobia bacterium]